MKYAAVNQQGIITKCDAAAVGLRTLGGILLMHKNKIAI